MTDPEFERAVQTLETLRTSVESSFREGQETGDMGRARMAQQRFMVRMRNIRSSQPDPYNEWLKGNARFLRAVEEGRNPILC